MATVPKEQENAPSYAACLAKRKQAFLAGAKIMIQHSKIENEEEEGVIKEAFLAKLNNLPRHSATETIESFCAQLILTLKTHPNFANIEDKEIYTQLRRAENLAAWFSLKPPETVRNKPLETRSDIEINGEKYTQLQRETPLSKPTLQQLEQMKNLFDDNFKKPTWFEEMAPWEQAYFIKGFEFLKNNNIKDNLENLQKAFIAKIGVPPCTFRAYPFLANYARHETFLMKNDESEENATLHTTRTRGAIVVPYLMNNKEERVEQTRENIEQILENELQEKVEALLESQKPELNENNEYEITCPVLLQTLITNFVPRSKQENQEDPMLNDKRKAIARMQSNKRIIKITQADGTQITVNVNLEFIETNHPINIVSFASWTSNNSMQKIKAFVNEFLAQNPNITNQDKIQELLKKYESLEKPHLPSQYIEAVNLQRAAYENLLIKECGGITTGSCKSGKDRKGTELLFADAIEMFYAVYKRFPDLLEGNNLQEDRKAFRAIFMQSFDTHHQEKFAGLSAHGSDGILHMEHFLPKWLLDIKELVIKRMLTRTEESQLTRLISESDKRGKLNKPKFKKIKKEIKKSTELSQGSHLFFSQTSQNDSESNTVKCDFFGDKNSIGNFFTNFNEKYNFKESLNLKTQNKKYQKIKILSKSNNEAIGDLEIFKLENIKDREETLKIKGTFNKKANKADYKNFLQSIPGDQTITISKGTKKQVKQILQAAQELDKENPDGNCFERIKLTAEGTGYNKDDLVKETRRWSFGKT